MKYLQYTIIGCVLLLYSCSGILDVNDDPTRIKTDEVTMSLLLPTVCEATSSAQYSAARTAMLATHHLDNVQAGYYQLFRMSGAWEEVYLKCLNNLGTIKTLAQEKNSPHYGGVARILEAVNIALLTDCFENIPYSEALKGTEDVTPAYDQQEAIYKDVFTLLDKGIELLQEEESEYSPGSDDMFYQGDLSQWIKLGHSLKARYMLHLLGKNQGITAIDILAEVDQGFTSNDDDFQLVYYLNFVNPWYNGIAAKIEQSIATQVYGEFFINLMNGEEYDVIDPRLPFIASNSDGDSAKYVGLASYPPFSDDTLYNALPTKGTFYMGPTSPLIIMSYSELKFIEAEVALNSDPSRAEASYLAGIEANMRKVGMTDDSAISTYTSDPAVATVDLEHILKEKYIATVYNVEAWNDMRRYQYDTTYYKGFYEPNYNNRSIPAYRSLYPTSEESRNAANWEANKKGFTEPMWKDQ